MLRPGALEESILQMLEQTRSCGATASHLHVPLPRVHRVAMMAFGAGRLDFNLVDY